MGLNSHNKQRPQYDDNSILTRTNELEKPCSTIFNTIKVTTPNFDHDAKTKPWRFLPKINNHTWEFKINFEYTYFRVLRKFRVYSYNVNNLFHENNLFQKNLESPFDSQQDSTKF